MEEQKKDVETVKVLFTHKTFLENVHDLGILKKKTIHDSTTSLVQPGSPEWSATMPKADDSMYKNERKMKIHVWNRLMKYGFPYMEFNWKLNFVISLNCKAKQMIEYILCCKAQIQLKSVPCVNLTQFYKIYKTQYLTN